MKTVTKSTNFESKMKLVPTKCDYSNSNTAMTHTKKLNKKQYHN